MPRIRAESIEEHKALTRREIMGAAADLFRAQGYSDTNLGDIAAHVGIGRTTLYEYFSDKEDILVSLVEEELPGLMDVALTGLQVDLTCRERLTELIVRGLEFVSDETNLGAMLMRELPNISTEAQMKVRRAHDGLAGAIGGVCREGVESGEFRDLDPRHASRLVYALMMSASSGLMRSPQAREEFQDVANTLLSLVFDGLATR